MSKWKLVDSDDSRIQYGCGLRVVSFLLSLVTSTLFT